MPNRLLRGIHRVEDWLLAGLLSGLLLLWRRMGQVREEAQRAELAQVRARRDSAQQNFKAQARDELNRALGELCSLHLMSGFPGFALLHLLHHRLRQGE